MAIQSFPFTSEVTYSPEGYPIFDRAVGSEVLRRIFSNYFTNGVFGLQSSSCFKVVSNQTGGMTIKVSPGVCLIEGATGYEDSETILQLSAADSLNRIDTVVLRLDDNKNVRAITLAIVRGSPATNPVKPQLTRNSSIYEIGLADISVRANVSTIQAVDITDTRLNADRCGFVTAGVKLDTSVFTTQMQAIVDKYMEIVRGALDGSLVGNLNSRMDSLSNQLTQLTTVVSQLNDKTAVQVKTVTLSSASWNNKVYAIQDVLVTKTPKESIQEIGAVPLNNPPTQQDIEYIELLSNANIVSAGQTNGILYLAALGDVPTKDINVQVIFRKQ